MRMETIRPILIGSANALPHLDAAMDLLQANNDALDAVISVVSGVEADPNDMTVGLGGLPNEEGRVQCDACVMHGPSRGAGAVAGLSDIVQAAQAARLVMEHTDHVLLAGEDAGRFAKKMGLKQSSLLTEEARARWEAWRADPQRETDWIDPLQRIPGGHHAGRGPQPAHEAFGGTVGCVGLDLRGDLSGAVTTSGLPWKIPGRVADSAVPGAGLYVNNKIGACTSTGRGEANIKTCGCFLAVTLMGQGLSPEEAGLEVCRRVVENTTEPYLLDELGRPAFNINYYLVNKRGQYGAVSMWSGRQYAVHDGQRSRLRETTWLYERKD